VVPLYVGTSGWQYRDWRADFYPPGLPAARWLEHVGDRFATVENNGTFYRLPAAETFASWARRTPADFVMAVKASRYLTHVRRLREPAEPVSRLLDAANDLGPRLGPILLQLPPDFRIDTDRLAGCLAEFRVRASRPVRVAVELRHDSWWTPPVHALLAEHGAALVWSDRAERPIAPLWRTAGWTYLRLHEGAGLPWPRYRAAALREWVARLADADTADGYVYFNNDQHAAAPEDALRFAESARAAGLSVARAR
jgi:uncharacterized protein YecE (DUF72 family)